MKAETSEIILSTLLQAIFLNTGAEVVKDQDGNTSILGQPTESALLELALNLGGDFNALRKNYEIKMLEPFNSVRKKMSVLVALPEGGYRAFCKGASEIVLTMCNRMIDSNGGYVDLSEEKVKAVTHVINGFASEALRTLCLAFKDTDDGGDKSSIPGEGYTLIAIVGLKDPVCPTVKNTV